MINLVAYSLRLFALVLFSSSGLLFCRQAAAEIPVDGDFPEIPGATVTAVNPVTGSLEDPLPYLQFDRTRIEEQPAIAVDDLLRTIPGFSLFRRTGSSAANPTTQGASLRGIAPSGTSRALVLYDGIPLNDAFGGWIPWSQIDLASIEQITVVRGGGSTVWGNTALGGVIDIIPQRPAENRLATEAAIGSSGTLQGSLQASAQSGNWGVGIDSRAWRTDGYQRVRRDQRGPVDIATSANHSIVNLTVEYSLPQAGRFTLRSGHFEEKRGNGTPLANNETTLTHLHAKYEIDNDADVSWRADGFFTRSDFASTFTALSPDRSSERIVLDQYSVPSDSIGASLKRSSPLHDTGNLTLGADARHVSGETRERIVAMGADRIAGGSQLFTGLFAEHDWQPDRGAWRILTGLRADYWQSHSGFIQAPAGSGQEFEDREKILLNSRLGLSHSVSALVTLRSSIYQAYRVPTINELYRPFQVGSDFTLANEELNPERLWGGEIGADLKSAKGWALRHTVFLNQVYDPIFNTTVGSSAQGGLLRQRQNISETRIRGIESELDYPIQENFILFAAYALTDARVRKADSQPGLVNNRLAQVPLHTAAAGLSYRPSLPGPAVRIQSRWNGAQFEDDLNTRRLSSYWTMDMFLRYRWNHGREVFITVENVFDRRFEDGIGGNGIVTQGPPRFVRSGLRWLF